MSKVHGYAAQSATTPMAPFSFERREPGQLDVAFDILHCGVCHSDLHTVRGEWGGTTGESLLAYEFCEDVGSETETDCEQWRAR